jgi:cysteine-rich repeat protein
MGRHRGWPLALALVMACDPDVRVEGTEVGDCSDGADNDGDGAYDCTDASCAGAPICASSDAGTRPDAGSLPDAGPLEDGGTPTPDDRCGEAEPSFVLARSETNLRIDTTGSADDIAQVCGAPMSGDDAFITVDVQAGEYWHFHLRADPADVGSASRDVAAYLLSAPAGACDARACPHFSDSCSGVGDEHFGFVADEPGRLYFGVDSPTAGGAVYLLDVLRPTCGENGREHGEACDDDNRDDGDGCTSRCTRELTEAIPNEVEPNDNAFEANAIVLPASGELTVHGNIGGSGACRYSDVFSVEVPAGAHFEVDALSQAAAPCDDAALTDGFELALFNVAGQEIVAPTVDLNGCAIVRSDALTAGRYFVHVMLPEELETIRAYRLRVRVVP